MSGGTTDETAAGRAVHDALRGEERVVRFEADESDAADLFANVGVDGPITFPEGDDQDTSDDAGHSQGDGGSTDATPSFGSDERYETAHDAFKALASEIRAEGDADVTADDLMLGDATAVLDLEDMETVAFEDLTGDADAVGTDDTPTFYLELDPDAGWNWRFDPDAFESDGFAFGGDGAPAGEDAVAEDVLSTGDRPVIDADGFDWSS